MNQRLTALSGSAFRASFRLREKEQAILRRKGLEGVLEDARQLLRARLALAQPLNDGRQTPKRGHPVFVAQHATATCCRGCLQKWHQVPQGRPMSSDEIERAVAVLGAWLRRQALQAGVPTDAPQQPRLFG